MREHAHVPAGNRPAETHHRRELTYETRNSVSTNRATSLQTSSGVASAIKMCRSVIVKGMEAIVIESFVAARRFGVENEVLASLAETFPGLELLRLRGDPKAQIELVRGLGRV